MKDDITFKKDVYLIGSFGGTWRDEFIDRVPVIDFDNPEDHVQSSIAKLDYTDMNGAMNCPASVVYLKNGKRAGTMSYCELGGARGRGNIIIAFDEDMNKDSLIKQIASYYYHDKEQLFHDLENKAFESKYLPITPNDKTANHKPAKNIVFAGDIESMDSLIQEVAKVKNVYTMPKLSNLENFSDKYDTIVTNFDKGKPHNKKGLFVMGLGYSLDVPVIELEGNVIPYPPLAGLSRRILVGKDRFEHAKQYLTNLQSQHITDEALVYYDLMKRFNQNGNQ
ncbi:hypothetical protein HOD29_05840 [archaeon]|jgi:hypothetical protein|nr:hypothetical protein [archaeon]